ncbi:MAG: Asp-tRNA(Asn)/Glu-tRNA(Gln) amidotransferase subunit GatC [Actinomycetota bacterium]|nr:Asp-tRNA(Asn)/Glu-tRNA(Gln) amidotransferase subunit GatC [Actinomycetota bacterium]
MSRLLPGAEPFRADGDGDRGRTGALVLHGFTGSPHSVRGVGRALGEAGLAVHAPLLPGHGTSPDDIQATAWEDWRAAAEVAWVDLTARCEQVVVFGLSMGGTLATALAADHPEIAGIVVVNPYIDPPADSFRDLLRGLLAAGETWIPGIGSDIALPGSREVGYGGTPITPLLSLCQALGRLEPRLPQVSCPVLILTSRVDHVVPTVSSDLLAERVSGPVERVWLERSFHAATLDFDGEEIERRTVAFVADAVTRWRGKSAPTEGAVPPPYDRRMADRISREDVAHVAALARLRLTDEELDRFTVQLGAVLDHAADVAALDTAGVAPTAHPLPLVNVLRDDVAVAGLDRDEVLSQAPAVEDGRFRVPRILGEAP